MKLPVTIAAVVALHVGVISMLLIQPGCNRTSSSQANPSAASSSPTGTETTADTASADYNSGMQPPTPSGVRADPTRPGEPVAADSASSVAEPSEVLKPLPSSGASTVAHSKSSYAAVRDQSLGSSAAAVSSGESGTYKVQKGDSFWSIAKKHGVSVKDLLAANHLDSNAKLRYGQSLVIPGAAAGATVASSEKSTQTHSSHKGATVSSKAASGSDVYVVQKGDSLAKVARKLGTTTSALKSANNLKGDTIRVGQKLSVPSGAAGVTTAPASQAVTSAAASTTHSSSSTRAPAKASASADVSHQVMPGETLAIIAKKYGMSVNDLMKLNNITDPAKIHAPKSDASSASVSTTYAGSTVKTTEAAAIKPANDASVFENLQDIPVVEVENKK